VLVKVATLLLAVLLVLFALAPSAFSTGPAFSGIAATADSAETTVNNPAGMTRLKEASFYGNPSVIYTRNKTEVTLETNGQKSISTDV
jgi:long-subunit fatty acid transport protein